MEPKLVAEIEQMLTNRHDMLHYNMKALRRAGLDLLTEMRSKEQQLQVAAEHMVSEMVCPSKILEKTCRHYAGDCKTCWLEHWRQQSGTFQNGNDQASAEKSSDVGKTVGEGVNG